MIFCGCGRDITECSVHGNLMARLLVERFGKRRFNIQDDVYHVTELTDCLRRSHLERKHPHPVTYAELLKKTKGLASHRAVFGYQSWGEMPVRKVVKLYHETVVIIGHIDYFDPVEQAIVEGKNTKYLNWQLTRRLLPRPRDVLQTQSYGTIWTVDYGFPLKRLQLAYWDDESPPCTFEVELRDLTDWLRSRVTRLHKSFLEESLPMAEPSSLCKFCPFKMSCDRE